MPSDRPERMENERKRYEDRRIELRFGQGGMLDLVFDKVIDWNGEGRYAIYRDDKKVADFWYQYIGALDPVFLFAGHLPEGKKRSGISMPRKAENELHERLEDEVDVVANPEKKSETKRLNPPTDREPPFTIDIVWESGSGTDSGVETWQYEGNTLHVQYTNGESITYPYGNVVEVH